MLTPLASTSRRTAKSAGDRQRAPLHRFQLGDRGVDVHHDADPRQQFAGEPALRRPGDLAGAGGGEAGDEADVLGRRQLADQAEVLVDEAQAATPRVGGRADFERLAVDQDDAARVGVVEAGEALDQRRLAGPVLTDQGMDLGAADLEADVLQGALPGERLREVLDLDERLRRRIGGQRILSSVARP
jgi:hypothetical protein